MWDIEVAQAHAVALISHLPPDRAELWGTVIRDGVLRARRIAAMTPGEQITLARDVEDAVDSMCSALHRDMVDELYRILIDAMGVDEVARRTTCEGCGDQLPAGGGIHDPGQVGVMAHPPFFCDQGCLDEGAERQGLARSR